MREKKDLLCFMTPTNTPSDLFEFLLPSIENILDIKEYCLFSFIFQKPYTSEQIKEIKQRLNKYGVNYVIQYREYDVPKAGYIPLMKMLNDSSLVNRNSLFYATLDDDMAFLEPTKLKSIGLQYLNLIYRMLEDTNIGVATIGDSKPFYLADKIFPLDIRYKRNFWTGRGMIYRNYSSQFVPEEISRLFGGNTDILPAVYNLIEHKSYAISCSNGLCSHCENRRSHGGIEFKWYSVNKLDDNKLTSYYYRKKYYDNIFDRKDDKLLSEDVYKKYIKKTKYDFSNNNIANAFTTNFNFELNNLKNKIDIKLSDSSLN